METMLLKGTLSPIVFNNAFYELNSQLCVTENEHAGKIRQSLFNCWNTAKNELTIKLYLF